MATVPSLKFISTEICLRTLIQENPSDNKERNTDNGVGHNSFMTHLFETLCFTAVSEDLLNRILKYCPDKLTDKLLKALAPPYTRELNLQGCENLRLMGLVDVLKKCCHVQMLNLTQLPHLIHPEVFTFIGLMKIPLTTLILESNNVTDDVIHSVLKNALNLSTLHVSSRSITDDVFLLDKEIQYTIEILPNKYEGMYMSKLTNISLNGCRQLSNNVVVHMVSLCGPSLKYIDISNTSCNCIALLYLAGYSLVSIIDIVLADDLVSDKSLETLLTEYKSIKRVYMEELKNPIDINEEISFANMVESHFEKSSTDNMGEPNSEKSSIHNIDESHSENSSIYKIDEPHSEKLSTDNMVESHSEKSSTGNIGEPHSEKLSTDNIGEPHSEKLSIGNIDEPHSEKLSTDNIGEPHSEKLSIDNIGEPHSEKLSTDNIGEPHSEKLSTDNMVESHSEKSSTDNIDEPHSEKLSTDNIGEPHSEKLTTDNMVESHSEKSSTDNIGEPHFEKLSTDNIGEPHFEKSSTDNIGEPHSEKLSTDNIGEPHSEKLSTDNMVESHSEKSSTDNIDEPHSEKLSTDNIGEPHSEKLSTDNIGEPHSEKLSTDNIGEPHFEKSSTDNIGEPHSEKSFTDNIGEPHSEKLSTDNIGEPHSEKLSTDNIGEPHSEKLSTDNIGEPHSEKSSTDSTGEPHSEKLSIHNIGESHSEKSSVESITMKSLYAINISTDLTECQPKLESRELIENGHVKSEDNKLNSASLKNNLQTSDSVSFNNVTDSSKLDDCSNIITHRNIKKYHSELDRCSNILEHVQCFDTFHRNRDILRYKPNILSLEMIGIKYVNIKLDQLCLKKFLDVNTSLQKFTMTWKGLTREYFPSIVCNMRNLREIDLEECVRLDNEGVTSLAQNCQKLQSVNLRGVKFFSEVSLLPFLKNKHLQHLNLAESIQITDKILTLISEQMKDSLTSLDLSWCEETPENGINEICRNCNNLKRLLLSKCQVSDVGLKLLAETCKGLTEITVQNGFEMDKEIISDEGIISIATNLTHLTFVDISWNLLITNVSISVLIKNCCELEEAHLRGLKQITEEPFLPIIPEHKDVSNKKGDNSYMLRYRSTVYARNLRVLSLEFCDLVDDCWLQKISNICRGSLCIEDYYGQELTPEAN